MLWYGSLIQAPSFAILLSLLPRTAALYSNCACSSSHSSRILPTMVLCSHQLSGNSGQAQQRQYTPVEIYPHDSDLSTIKATGRYVAFKRIHFIRHAEGTHNVNREYKNIINLDARLTELGEKQCKDLAEELIDRRILQTSELVVTSPLTRCLQTALLSFPSLAEATNEPNAVNSKATKIPFVAHESIRETVNYACDRRRRISELEPHYHERICFRHIEHDHDELWESYVRRVGTPEEYDKHRESAELHTVANRGRDFFDWVRERPEQEIIVCTHSAFLRCILNWGQSGGVPMMMPQALTTRSNENSGQQLVMMSQELDDSSKFEHQAEVPVVSYCGDERFEEYMRLDYENCELRSFVVAFPH